MKTITLVIALFLSISVHAGIGTVTELTGSALIKRGGKTITVAKSLAVEMNDRIETKNGRAKITFEDGTVVTVTESSALLVDDFVYDPKSGAGKLGLKAAGGTVRYVSGKIAHSNPNSVKINTPTASIAVRGTDFVMSVDESGSSMIILMPSCETGQNINLSGLTCGSGRIDVESGGTVVTLDRPYQATIAETAGSPPSPPIVVDLNGSPVGNGLMLSPPKTGSGASIVAAAKSAAGATGDRTGINSAEARQVATKSDGAAQAQKRDVEQTAGDVLIELGSELSSNNKLAEADVKVDDVISNESVYKIWHSQNPTVQTGWGYERLSSNGLNYVHIVLPMDTKALIVVTQNLVTDAYNSNTMSSRSYGTIVINQSYR